MKKIITADERLAEKRGAKILIVGPTGVGKTSLLRTHPAAGSFTVMCRPPARAQFYRLRPDGGVK